MVPTNATSTTEANKQLVRREVTEAWNGGNLDIVDELFAEDCVDHVPLLPEEMRGREGHKEMIQAFRSTFPDLEMSIDELVAEGDTVAFRFTLRGTHDGDFIGIEATGNPVELTGSVFARVEDGRIAEAWAQFDALGLLRQLEFDAPPSETGLS